MLLAKKKHRRKVEDEQHKACIAWLNEQYPEKSGWCFFCCNESLNGARAGIERKKKGVRAGVPDLWHCVPTAYSSMLVVEFKAAQPDDARLSKEQRDWIVYLRNIGITAAVARGVDEYKALVRHYFKDAIEPGIKKYKLSSLYTAFE